MYSTPEERPGFESLEYGVEEARQELYGLLNGILDRPELSDPGVPGLIVESGGYVYTMQYSESEIYLEQSETPEVTREYTVNRYGPSNTDEPPVWLELKLLPPTSGQDVSTGEVDLDSAMYIFDESIAEDIDEHRFIADIKHAIRSCNIEDSTLARAWDGFPPDFLIEYNDTHVLAGVEANQFYEMAELHDCIERILGFYPQSDIAPVDHIEWGLPDTLMNNKQVRFLSLETFVDKIEVSGFDAKTLQLLLEFPVPSGMSERLWLRVRFNAAGELRNTDVRFMSPDRKPIVVTSERRLEMIEALRAVRPSGSWGAWYRDTLPEHLAPDDEGPAAQREVSPWSRAARRSKAVGETALDGSETDGQ